MKIPILVLDNDPELAACYVADQDLKSQMIELTKILLQVHIDGHDPLLKDIFDDEVRQNNRELFIMARNDTEIYRFLVKYLLCMIEHSDQRLSHTGIVRPELVRMKLSLPPKNRCAKSEAEMLANYIDRCRLLYKLKSPLLTWSGLGKPFITTTHPLETKKEAHHAKSDPGTGVRTYHL